ncbi:MAG: hypothetical protein ACPH6D_07375, partial [Candidatus Puniceispirillales bacterium]
MNINNGMKTLAMVSLVTAMGITMMAQDTRPVYADSHMQKMTVEADMELEWRRDDQQYIARGNAVITTKDMIFHADTITAEYEKDADTGNNRIMLMTGDGQAKVVHLDKQGQENMRGIA